MRTALVTAALIGTVALGATNAQARGDGEVHSHKTRASAHVAPGHRAQFQAYIDDLEARGSVVRFIGGYRKGHCSERHQHSCGTAIDVCQRSRGVVDPSCHLPPRREIAEIAASHGLFEGGRWCHSDYGHAQVGVSADCGTSWASVSGHHRRRVASGLARHRHHRRYAQR